MEARGPPTGRFSKLGSLLKSLDPIRHCCLSLLFINYHHYYYNHYYHCYYYLIIITSNVTIVRLILINVVLQHCSLGGWDVGMLTVLFSLSATQMVGFRVQG